MVQMVRRDQLVQWGSRVRKVIQDPQDREAQRGHLGRKGDRAPLVQPGHRMMTLIECDLSFREK